MSLECQNTLTLYGIGHGQLLTLTHSSRRRQKSPRPGKGAGRGEGLARDSQHSKRRKIMKRALTSIGFVMAFVSLLVLGLVSRVQARECSNASLKGTYGASCDGTIVGVGPVAVVSVLTAD